MFKTGSKFFYGLAAFGFVAAILWSMATGDQEIGMDSLLGPITMGYKGYVGDHIGYSVLVALSLASLCLALFTSALRDSDADAQAQVVGLETVPEVPAPVRINYWPVVGAFSAAALVLGLAVHSNFFLLGLVGLTIVTVEWAVNAWADRATGDPEVNQSLRDRLMRPIEIPVGAVLVVAVLVLAVSRILLAIPKVSGYVLFGLVPALFLAFGALLVLRPAVSRSVITGVMVVGGIAILVGGAVAAIVGPREHKDKSHSEEGKEGEEGLAPLPEPGQLVIRVAD
jgi:uncharacterized protein involved in response to NO